MVQYREDQLLLFYPKELNRVPVLKQRLKSIYDRFLNNQKWMGKDSHVETEIQPLSDVHFNSKYAGGGEWVKAINTQWLWFFGSCWFCSVDIGMYQFC